MALSILRLWRAILFSTAIITSVCARTFSERTRNRGLNHQLFEGSTSGPQKRQAPLNSTTDFRFLTNVTEPFRVESLPEVDFDVGEMYSGLVPINMSDPSRALFFVFQPTIGEPVDEIVIWLNGGPGCSSLEGFFQENGRFVWATGMYEPVINQYSWVNLTNMLWVEQPVGTGFSIGTVEASTEEQIAEDFANFFLNWQNIFGISNFKIFVTGESYAGRYVPYISAEMIDRDDEEHFNLSGAITYDPVIGSFEYIQEEVVAYPFLEANNAMLGLNSSYVATLQALDESCGYAAYREKYLTFPPPGIQPVTPSTSRSCDIFDLINDAAFHPNPCFNIYSINNACPFMADPLGFPTAVTFSYPSLIPVYFDRDDVKAAMHAPTTVDWKICGGPVFVGRGGPEGEGDLSLDPIQNVLPKVIEHTNRVLVGNGDYDMIIITNGTLLAIQNMTWNGQLGFQSQPSTNIEITLPDLQYMGVERGEDPQGLMGIQHFERGLMWAETFFSGHMQPQFQPRSSYRHLQWLLGHIETL